MKQQCLCALNRALLTSSTRSITTSPALYLRLPPELVKHPKSRAFRRSDLPDDSFAAKSQNLVYNKGKNPRRFLPRIPMQYIFVGDIVYIKRGKDKGMRGWVLQVIESEAQIIVGGRNCDVGEDGETEMQQGMKSEHPLNVEDVCLIDPSDEKPCQVEFRYTELGETVRVSKRTGYLIPFPAAGIDASLVRSEDGARDTTKAAAVRQTYDMPLATFEQDLLRHYGFEEDLDRMKSRKRTWWY